jgi:hypothetical protein
VFIRVLPWPIPSVLIRGPDCITFTSVLHPPASLIRESFEW